MELKIVLPARGFAVRRSWQLHDVALFWVALLISKRHFSKNMTEWSVKQQTAWKSRGDAVPASIRRPFSRKGVWNLILTVVNLIFCRYLQKVKRNQDFFFFYIWCWTILGLTRRVCVQSKIFKYKFLLTHIAVKSANPKIKLTQIQVKVEEALELIGKRHPTTTLSSTTLIAMVSPSDVNLNARFPAFVMPVNHFDWLLPATSL